MKKTNASRSSSRIRSARGNNQNATPCPMVVICNASSSSIMNTPWRPKCHPHSNANRSDKTPVRKINENQIGPYPARCREGYDATVEIPGKPTRIVVKSLGCARNGPRQGKEQGNREIAEDDHPGGIRTPFSEQCRRLKGKHSENSNRKVSLVVACSVARLRPSRKGMTLEVPPRSPFPSSHQL